MPTVQDLLGNLLEGVVDYQDIVLSIAFAGSMLLLIAGTRIAVGAGTSDKARSKQGLALFIAAIVLASILGLPSFIPYAKVDWITPGVPVFPIWSLVGLFLGLAFYRMRAGRPVAAVLSILGALLLMPIVIPSTMSLLGMGYSPNLIWASYFLPPLLAGILLAWTTTGIRLRHYLFYVLSWIAIVALVVLPSYIGAMYNIQYTLESATSAQRYLHAPEAGPMIDQSIKGELVVSVTYVAYTLALLFLPLVIANLSLRTRVTSVQSGITTRQNMA